MACLYQIPSWLRVLGSTSSGYFTPWGVRVLHGFDNGFPKMVVKDYSSNTFFIMDDLEHTIIYLRITSTAAGL